MLIPRKNEDLKMNLLVLGAGVIQILKRKPYNIETLYQEVKLASGLDVVRFHDILTTLWVANIIELNDYQIYLRKE